MNFERTSYGILVGEKHLSAHEALDLLQWLSEQKDVLRHMSEALQTSPVPLATHGQQAEWSQAEEEEIRSEDEQIARLDL